MKSPCSPQAVELGCAEEDAEVGDAVEVFELGLNCVLCFSVPEDVVLDDALGDVEVSAGVNVALGPDDCVVP